MIQILGTIFDAIHILIYFPIPSTFHPLICISNVIPILYYISRRSKYINYDKNEIVHNTFQDIHKEDISVHPSN